LLVPRPVGLSRDVTVQAADNGQVTLSPEVITRKTTVKAGKHDTVASLAKRYGVSAANVAEWNHVSVTAGFSPKQSVVLFLPVKKARGAAHATKGKPSRVAPH
jgi:membrane-bound lytic murein transglycosylase D